MYPGDSVTCPPSNGSKILCQDIINMRLERVKIAIHNQKENIPYIGINADLTLYHESHSIENMKSIITNNCNSIPQLCYTEKVWENSQDKHENNISESTDNILNNIEAEILVSQVMIPQITFIMKDQPIVPGLPKIIPLVQSQTKFTNNYTSKPSTECDVIPRMHLYIDPTHRYGNINTYE
jgi:hypothetical protein